MKLLDTVTLLEDMPTLNLDTNCQPALAPAGRNVYSSVFPSQPLAPAGRNVY